MLEALRSIPTSACLTYLGVSYAQTGNPATGAGILRVATRLYPKDEGAHFNLGWRTARRQTDERSPNISAPSKSIRIISPRYLNWGGALYAKGQYEEALQLYRKGLTSTR